MFIILWNDPSISGLNVAHCEKFTFEEFDFRRQGLCRAMLAHTINNEIKQGCHKFVLVATQAGQKTYSNFGFQILSSRYDYILENSSSSKNG